MMYRELFAALVGVALFIVVPQFQPNKSIVVFTAVLYIFVVIYCTGFKGTRAGLSSISMRFPLPFWKALTTHHYGKVTNRSILNIILFIPFGYLLPACVAICQTQQLSIRWWQVVLTGFIFSLVIECSQYIFQLGVFELDDLVKNTIGSGLGYGIWKLLNKNECKNPTRKKK